MPLSELKPADVLLFEGEDDTIDNAIMFLTHSKLTHAALYYRTGALADAGLSGIGVHALSDDPKGRRIHARRMGVELDPGPVLAAAKGYVDNGEPYDKPGLVMVGLILIYKKFTPTSLVQKAAIALLKRICASVDKWINEHYQHGKKPMVCSQYVFQCFQDASKTDPRYELVIRQGVVSLQRGHEDSLLHRVAAHPRSEALMTTRMPASIGDVEGTDEELVGNLIDAMKQSQSPSIQSEVGLDDELVEQVHRLGDLLRNAQGSEDTDGVSYLMSQESLFVTPEDLYSNCPSLAMDMQLSLHRDEANLPS